MSLSIIMAMAKNNIIGRENDLPWKLPTDLKRFKTLTSGKTIIMGRKCYESIGRPLPNRVNVIVTRDKDFKAEGCEVRYDLHDAIAEFHKDIDEEVFIIGGAQIYNETFAIADKLYLTDIVDEVEGDIKVEGLDKNDWVCVNFEGNFVEDKLTYRFMDFLSKKEFEKQWQKD